MWRYEPTNERTYLPTLILRHTNSESVFKPNLPTYRGFFVHSPKIEDMDKQTNEPPYLPGFWDTPLLNPDLNLTSLPPGFFSHTLQKLKIWTNEKTNLPTSLDFETHNIWIRIRTEPPYLLRFFRTLSKIWRYERTKKRTSLPPLILRHTTSEFGFEPNLPTSLGFFAHSPKIEDMNQRKNEPPYLPWFWDTELLNSDSNLTSLPASFFSHTLQKLKFLFIPFFWNAL